MQVANPSEYFDGCQLRESRVLRFAFNGVERQIELDIDYAAEVVSHWFEAKLAGADLHTYQPLPSDFRRLIFSDVSWGDAIPTPVSSEGTSDEWVDVLKADSKLPVVASFEMLSVDQTYVADLKLERNGDFRFRFTFGSLSVLQRSGRPKPGDSDPRFREDVDTGELFEFLHPFGLRKG